MVWIVLERRLWLRSVWIQHGLAPGCTSTSLLIILINVNPKGKWPFVCVMLWCMGPVMVLDAPHHEKGHLIIRVRGRTTGTKLGPAWQPLVAPLTQIDTVGEPRVCFLTSLTGGRRNTKLSDMTLCVLLFVFIWMCVFINLRKLNTA